MKKIKIYNSIGGLVIWCSLFLGGQFCAASCFGDDTSINEFTPLKSNNCVVIQSVGMPEEASPIFDCKRFAFYFFEGSIVSTSIALGLLVGVEGKRYTEASHLQATVLGFLGFCVSSRSLHVWEKAILALF